MTAAFASLPLLAVVGLMLGLRWRAAYAALAGLALAVALAVGPFGLGVARLSEAPLPGPLARRSRPLVAAWLGRQPAADPDLSVRLVAADPSLQAL